jgi:hypothetical protein
VQHRQILAEGKEEKLREKIPSDSPRNFENTHTMKGFSICHPICQICHICPHFVSSRFTGLHYAGRAGEVKKTQYPCGFY